MNDLCPALLREPGSGYIPSVAVAARSPRPTPISVLADLDPGNAAFQRCGRRRVKLRDELTSENHEAAVKLPAKTGLHVLVPHGVEREYDEARGWARREWSGESRRLCRDRRPRKFARRSVTIVSCTTCCRTLAGHRAVPPYVLSVQVPGGHGFPPLKWSELRFRSRPERCTSVRFRHAWPSERDPMELLL